MRWTLESEARRNLNWQRGRSLLISGGGTGRARSRQQAQKKKGKKRQYASVHRKRKEYRPPDEAPSNGGSAAVSPNLLCREGRVIQCPCFEGANRSLPFARHSSLAVSSPRKPGGSALFFFCFACFGFFATPRRACGLDELLAGPIYTLERCGVPNHQLEVSG